MAVPKDKSPCFERNCEHWDTKQRVCVASKKIVCPIELKKKTQ